jgi:methylase of polypeptide subunit release factors
MNATETRLLALGTEMLTRAGVETPEADARVLVALFERRAKREPLAYIVGSCRFCGLELVVDRRVLIPTDARGGSARRSAWRKHS